MVVTLFGNVHTDVFRGIRDHICNLSSKSSKKNNENEKTCTQRGEVQRDGAAR